MLPYHSRPCRTFITHTIPHCATQSCSTPHAIDKTTHLHTIRVWIFTEYKTSWFLQIAFRPRNSIPGYIGARDMNIYVCAFIYEISCISLYSGDDDDLDCILGRPVSDEIVAMTKSLQLTTRLLAEPPGRRINSHNDASSTVELPPRKGRIGGTAGRKPLPEALSTSCWCVAFATSIHYWSRE